MEALLIPVTEAARLTGFSRSQAYELVHDGVWPCVRVRRSVRVPLAALRAWVENHTDGVDQPTDPKE